MLTLQIKFLNFFYGKSLDKWTMDLPLSTFELCGAEKWLEKDPILKKLFCGGEKKL